MMDRKIETRMVGPSSGRVTWRTRLVATRAVDERGLLDLARDVLQPREHDDHVEAEVLPRDDDEQRIEHDRAVRQPELDEEAKPDGLEHLVDHPAGVSINRKTMPAIDLGDDVRREEEQPQHRPAGELAGSARAPAAARRGSGSSARGR